MMKSTKRATIVVLLVIATFCIGVSSGHTKPNIPRSDIPTDISEELQKIIEALYSPVEDEQIKAIRRLGEMGSEAASALPFLMGMLDDSISVRAEVVDLLKKMGEPATMALVAALKDESEDMRCYTVETLGRIGTDNTVAPLLEALKDTSWKVRVDTAKALGQIGKTQAVGPLIDALKDENDNVQYNAAAALGKIGDARATEPLVAALMNKSKYVRQHSAQALGQIGDAKAAKYLVKALRDAEPDVRANAAKALGKMKHQGSMKFLIAVLEDVKPSVRYAAAEALTELSNIPGNLKEPVKKLYSTNRMERSKAAGDLAAMGTTEISIIPFLTGVLGERGMTGKRGAETLVRIGKPAVKPLILKLKSDNSKARENAAWVLGQIKDESAIKPLINALGDTDKSVQSVAEKALVSIGRPAIGDLVKSLNDKRAKVRAHVVKALGDMKSIDCVEPLIKALGDSNADVRSYAAYALGRIEDPRAVEPLIAAIRDTSWKVRANAIEALGRLGDIRAAEPIIAAMKDIKSEVRVKIVDALGELRYNKGIEHLVFALNDTNRDVRYHTADALTKITGKRFGRDISKWKKWRQEFLFSTLSDRKASAETKIMALELLQEVKDPNQIERLFMVLKRDRMKPEVCEQAAEALRKITGESFGKDYDTWEIWWRKDSMAGLESNDHTIRANTAKKLGELHNALAIKYLIVALKDTFPGVRNAAAEALEKITGKEFGTETAAWEDWWEASKSKFQRAY